MSRSPTMKPAGQSTLLEVPAGQKPEGAEQSSGGPGRFVSPRCFFADLASVLDFSPVLKAYTKECGQPPYHPVMMTLLLMYAYARGVTSSREIERRCETDLGFRYLAGGERPDHDTLCTFRVRHLEAFRALFVDTLRVATEARPDSRSGVTESRKQVRAGACAVEAPSWW